VTADADADVIAHRLCAWIRSMSTAELQLADVAITEILSDRHSWARHDHDKTWHAIVAYSGGSVVTRCRGRWSLRDGFETASRPPQHERCAYCQDAHVADNMARAATLPVESGSEIDEIKARLTAATKARWPAVDEPALSPVESGQAELATADVKVLERPEVRFEFDMSDGEDEP